MWLSDTLILPADRVGRGIVIETGGNSDSNDGNTLEKSRRHEFASNITFGGDGNLRCEYLLAQQVVLGASIKGTLDQFDAIDLTFDLNIAI